jgi:hypothetical protein
LSPQNQNVALHFEALDLLRIEKLSFPTVTFTVIYFVHLLGCALSEEAAEGIDARSMSAFTALRSLL